MGCGGFVMPVLATTFLEKYGWRTGYFIFAFFLLALLIPINLWIRQKPEESAPRTGGDGGMNPRDSIDPAGPGEGRFTFDGMTVAESARTASFWMLGIGDFFIAIVFTGVMVHM
jgi:MFS family permease